MKSRRVWIVLTLLLLVCGGIFGIRWWREQRAIAEIERLGGWVPPRYASD